MSKSNNKKITDKQEDIVVNLYLSGKNTYEIGRILNMWPNSIRDTLIRKKIPRRNRSECQKRCSLKSDIFKNIKTSENAYWLGFLCADGYNNEKKGQISIGLSIKDINHLKQFKKFIGSDRKITIYKTGKNKHLDSCCISISDRDFSSDLAKNGCFQRKSLTLKFPTFNQVPKNLIWHFLRGYFDGDGSISLNDYSLSIATSKFFAESLKDFCSKNDIDSYIYKPKKVRCYYFKIGKRIEFAKFFENLYKNSDNLRLERKYERYEKTIKRFDKQIETMYNHLKLRNIIK